MHPCAESININDRIMSMYVDNLLPEMCEGGDDNNYGSASLCDLACLQTISRRIHYGKYVAESKFMAQPEEYTELIQAQDAEGLMALLTNQAVEDRVVRRVENKAKVFGVGHQRRSSESCVALGSDSFKLAPERVADLYYRWIMPMTKDVQVQYLCVVSLSDVAPISNSPATTRLTPFPIYQYKRTSFCYNLQNYLQNYMCAY